MTQEQAASGDGDEWARGKATMDAVYGDGFSAFYPGREELAPFSQTTVEQLFAHIWTRPGLSIRDRRLLIMGATAALGLGDPLRTQALGALRNNELDPDQLREAALQLAYYIGWPKGVITNNAFADAIGDFNA